MRVKISYLLEQLYPQIKSDLFLTDNYLFITSVLTVWSPIIILIWDDT